MLDDNYKRYPLSGILLETCSSWRMRFAVKRTLQRGLPILLSLTYQHDAKGKIVTLSGYKPEWFARRAKDWGVTLLGVNCGRDIDMSDIIEIIRRYRQETDLPLFARPNAGTPTKQDGRWVWPHSAESMAARLPELIDAGACMIGGCCGTTPEYIAAFRRVLNGYFASGSAGDTLTGTLLTAGILEAIIALTSRPLAASRRIAMNPPNLPPDLPNDSDVERIRARIREQRFVLVDKRRVLLWSFGIGAACGVLLGIWRAADHYVRSTVGGQGGGFYFCHRRVGDLIQYWGVLGA